MIPQKMKKKAKELRCPNEVRNFGICAKEQGFLMPFKCRQEAHHLKLCLESTFADKDFVDLCTKEYLEERTEYRRTGIKTHDRKKHVAS
jgi:COX assembly mitochondrial protein 1